MGFIQTTHSAPILVETLGFSVLFCLDSAENTMYVYAHQFNDSSWSPDLAWLEFYGSTEVGNAANKLSFWYSFGAVDQKKNSKALTHEKTD